MRQIDEAGLRPGEDAELKQERERLRSAYGNDISLDMAPGPDGSGTRVTVRMPLVTAPPEAPASPPEPSPFGPSRFLP